MPKTEVVFFAEDKGRAPVLEWLDDLPAKVQNKFIARIELLAELGHELRRPLSDYLRDGVHELRARHVQVHYRILYFYHGQRAVLSHGITKKGKVPDNEIDRAVRRRGEFKRDPERHTYRE